MKAEIGVSRIKEVPDELIREFVNDLPSDHFDVKIRTHGSILAGIEWLMPTAIVLFFARAYFDAIFAELGKDHYKVLKRCISALYQRACTLKITKIGTRGKIPTSQRYTAAFSITVSINDGLVIKMLFQPALAETDTERAMTAFFDLLESTTPRTSSSEMSKRFGPVRVIGRTLLVAYDLQKGALVALDPIDPPPTD
jgi:hypothetical protein